MAEPMPIRPAAAAGDGQILYTIREAAGLMRLSYTTVYLLIKRKEIDCVRVGRAVRVSRSAIERWAERREKMERYAG